MPLASAVSGSTDARIRRYLDGHRRMNRSLAEHPCLQKAVGYGAEAQQKGSKDYETNPKPLAAAFRKARDVYGQGRGDVSPLPGGLASLEFVQRAVELALDGGLVARELGEGVGPLCVSDEGAPERGRLLLLRAPDLRSCCEQRSALLPGVLRVNSGSLVIAARVALSV
jgi:hypothetical protein